MNQPQVHSRCRSFGIGVVSVLISGFLIALVPSGMAQSTNGLSLVASGLSAPSGLTLGLGLQVYVSDTTSGVVYRVRSPGAIQAEAWGVAGPRGVAFDPAGNMYVADAGAGKVYRLDKNGQTTVLANNLADPRCLGFDPAGNLLVSHALDDGSVYGAVTRLAADGRQTTIATGLLDPQGLVVDGQNRVIIAAQGAFQDDAIHGPGLFQVDEFNRLTQLVDVGTVTPSGIALSQQGTLFFSGIVPTDTPRLNDGAVFIVHGAKFEPYVTGFFQPRAIALSGEALYVADADAGEVWRVTLAGGGAATTTNMTIAGALMSGSTVKSVGGPVKSQAAADGTTSASGSISSASTGSGGSATKIGGGGIQPLAGCFNAPPNKRYRPDQDPMGGEPIDLYSGVFGFERTDLVVPGVMPIVFKHMGRGENDSEGRMGIGGGDSYDYRIREVIGNEAQFALPTNERFTFIKQADGTYINTNTAWLAGARLYDSGYDWEMRFRLRFKDGTTFFFGPGSWSYALTHIIDANGNALHLVTNNGDLLEIQAPGGRRLAVTTVDGRITRITDNLGRSVSYVYSNSLLVAVTNALGGVTSYTYANNDPVSITLPNGVKFLENIYDTNSRIVTQILANAGTFSFDYLTDGSGMVTQTVMRNPLGVATRYNFNAAGHNTSIVDALGNTMTFLRDGNVVVTGTVDPLDRTNTVVFDANYNVAAITNAQNKVTRFTYEPEYGRLLSVVDPLGRTNSFGYDWKGNLTTIVNPFGLTTHLTYNDCGQPTTVMDALSNVCTFTYGPNLDLESVTDPLGNTVTRFVDLAGRSYALRDPFGRTTRINYDALNRVTDITDPINGVTWFGYDVVGNLTNVTDALNHSVSYGYDVSVLPTVIAFAGEW